MDDYMINIDEDTSSKVSDINDDVIHDIIECMKPLSELAEKVYNNLDDNTKEALNNITDEDIKNFLNKSWEELDEQ